MSEVVDQHRLADYLAKRAKWLSWYETGAGESNSLQDQWFAMLLSEMSFRVVREEGAKDPTSILNVPLVAHLLNSGYYSSQVLATRRLLESCDEKKIKNKNAIISLCRLINDIRANLDLITREVYVSFDGTAYAPELPEQDIPGLQPAESPLSEWIRSRDRHERFDKLSNVLPGNRARDNKIDESVLLMMDGWIESPAASKLITISHKYLAHAAQQSTIRTAVPTGLSFAEVEGIQKAVVRSMRVIYDIILSSDIYSEVVPMVPLGFFGTVWNEESLIESTARMNKQWDEMAEERNKWVRDIDNDLFTSLADYRRVGQVARS
jgi:hypothetical protein